MPKADGAETDGNAHATNRYMRLHVAANVIDVRHADVATYVSHVFDFRVCDVFINNRKMHAGNTLHFANASDFWDDKPRWI